MEARKSAGFGLTINAILKEHYISRRGRIKRSQNGQGIAAESLRSGAF